MTAASLLRVHLLRGIIGRNQGPRTGKMRLSVALSSAGVASRRKSEDIIRTGTVTVNGTVADLPQVKPNYSTTTQHSLNNHSTITQH
jgi:16S rRNA U516 pseudouridylate synthase RsuA-like enzyme